MSTEQNKYTKINVPVFRTLRKSVNAQSNEMFSDMTTDDRSDEQSVSGVCLYVQI